MSEGDYIVHSAYLGHAQSGMLLNLPREQARWEWMSFFVRRLLPEEEYQTATDAEESAFVILGGKCRVDWGEGAISIGARADVFDGFPYTVYLPSHNQIVFVADTLCEIAECRVPSTGTLNAKLISPADVKTSLRGGGNASRQIVDIITPDFPADRLMVIEVYTPGGNWSSYPPHKHDVHNPPAEVDLDEIYYYRMRQPQAFALQRLYSDQDRLGRTIEARDGDAVLVRSGFHPVVAGPGYDVYYLNCLAGSSRALSVTEDPNHVWIRSTWSQTDPRLPLIAGHGTR
jgi:5-deoxy-glucuronate isomerase